MSDLISRSGLLDAFNNLQPIEFGRSIAGMVALRMVNAAPSVDAEPVRHAVWKIRTDEYDCEYMECSACGGVFYDGENDTIDMLYNYCPECGAKMDGDADEQ